MRNVFFLQPHEYFFAFAENRTIKNFCRNVEFFGTFKSKSLRVITEQQPNFNRSVMLKSLHDFFRVSPASRSKNGDAMCSYVGVLVCWYLRVQNKYFIITYNLTTSAPQHFNTLQKC